MAKIIKLLSENVKRLRAVELEPDPEANVVIVRGMNGEGKTSLLDSIEYLLGGARRHPPRVIRDGESHARVVAETEELIITRRWWSADAVDNPERGRLTTELEVKSKATGKMEKAPQAVLDKLWSALSFDPLAFIQMESAKQVETLRKLAGLDLTDLEAKRQELEPRRTAAKADVAGVKNRLAKLPERPEKKLELVDTQELLKRQAEWFDRGQKIVAARKEKDAAHYHLKLQVERVKAARAELEKQEQILERLEKEAIAKENALDEVAVEDGAVSDQLEKLRKAIGDAEEHNRMVRELGLRDSVEAELLQAEAKLKKLEDAIDAIDGEKKRRVGEAKFPIADLGLSQTHVLFRGLPLEQASAAERLRVSVAMGLALHPKLKVLLVRDASLLDARSLALVREMAAEADAQVWLEMVGEDGPATVVIRDGADMLTEMP
jgi:hypothetical protein